MPLHPKDNRLQSLVREFFDKASADMIDQLIDEAKAAASVEDHLYLDGDLSEFIAPEMKPAIRYRCPQCDGQGQFPSSGVPEWCTLCGGTGVVAFDPSK